MSVFAALSRNLSHCSQAHDVTTPSSLTNFLHFASMHKQACKRKKKSTNEVDVATPYPPLCFIENCHSISSLLPSICFRRPSPAQLLLRTVSTTPLISHSTLYFHFHAAASLRQLHRLASLASLLPPHDAVSSTLPTISALLPCGQHKPHSILPTDAL